ncbi:MAG TPA: FAD-dependent oxidoreductase [Clostridia bacterium]|jgi:hypothetical protein|nr:FAD-dependent oxidoreductase [Clostridia bacterium]HPZ51511.1 FAD-dependent oxidoreductase [Clostridia bacterium]
MTFDYGKKIEVRYDVDVCVIGGGPAGVAAGVTAARQGARVLMIDSNGFFGGAATAALVPAFMRFANGDVFLSGGIGREIYDACEIEKYGTGIRVEKLKRIYDNMVIESGCDFLFHTNLIDVVVENGFVKYAIVSAKSGIYAIKAKVFVDATGDGDLCAMAGNPYEMGDEDGKCMPATLCSIWVDIDWDNVQKPDSRELARAFADGVFTQEDYHLSGMWRTGEHLGGGNIGHCYNVVATDERSLTQAMVTGRKILPEFEKYYREYLGGGYANTSVAISGSYLGVRESRRIVGEYVLNEEDYVKRASFDDEIGRYYYPIDIHPDPSKDSYDKFLQEFHGLRYQPGESYGIPYRSLVPVKLANVLVGGRCISTDKKMQSSIRVMPGCYITGQACGMASVLAANKDGETRNVNIRELQDKLRSIGGYLPK